MPIIPTPEAVRNTHAIEDTQALFDLANQRPHWTLEDPQGRWVYENADVRIFIDPKTGEMTVDPKSDPDFITLANWMGVKTDG